MGNETEREAFEAEWMARRADDEGNPAPRPLRSIYDHEQYRGSGANGSWVWFQRGAAYQREQVKGLVEALAALIADYDGEIHNEYDGTSMLDGLLAKINYAREAIAQSQEGK